MARLTLSETREIKKSIKIQAATNIDQGNRISELEKQVKSLKRTLTNFMKPKKDKPLKLEGSNVPFDVTKTED